MTVLEKYATGGFDLLIALHARKSAQSVKRFRELNAKPVVVAMTGTDLHVDLHQPRSAQSVTNCLEMATRIVMLEHEGSQLIERRFRKKVDVIYQSARVFKPTPKKLTRFFEVSVIGHLRPVKHPLHTAQAVRELPPDSRIKVIQIGSALSETMQQQAEKEMSRNPRYRWLGLMSHRQTQRRLARSHLTVVSSRVEGAPSVISEAVVNQVPVIASRITGTIGTLPKNYPGFYRCGDIEALKHLLLRCESDPEFYHSLKSSIGEIKSRFSSGQEIESWKQLLQRLKP